MKYKPCKLYYRARHVCPQFQQVLSESPSALITLSVIVGVYLLLCESVLSIICLFYNQIRIYIYIYVCQEYKISGRSTYIAVNHGTGKLQVMAITQCSTWTCECLRDRERMYVYTCILGRQVCTHSYCMCLLACACVSILCILHTYRLCIMNVSCTCVTACEYHLQMQVLSRMQIIIHVITQCLVVVNVPCSQQLVDLLTIVCQLTVPRNFLDKRQFSMGHIVVCFNLVHFLDEDSFSLLNSKLKFV